MPTTKPLNQAKIISLVKDRALDRVLNTLCQNNHICDLAFSQSPEALLTECASELSIDLVLLELSAIKTRTSEIVQHLQHTRERGILVFSTPQQADQKLEALTAGADMYIDLPVVPPLLEASLNNLFKRVQQIQSVNTLIEQADKPWLLNNHTWQVTTPDNFKIHLTATELTLLQNLIEQKKKPVSRYQLAKELGRQQCDNYERYINTLISRLRHKLNQDTEYPANIKASRGQGYQLTTHFQSTSSA